MFSLNRQCLLKSAALWIVQLIGVSEWLGMCFTDECRGIKAPPNVLTAETDC